MVDQYEAKPKMRKSMWIIPIMHLLMYVSICFDISFLRQITVFIYLSFIPGFVLLRILRLKEVNAVDTLLFSVGLSIAFVMFIGLLINELYPILGISQPLSTIPLTITSVVTLILFFVGYREDLLKDLNSSSVGRELKDVFPKSLFLILPFLLSILGAVYVSVPIMLLSIAIIATLYAISASSNRVIPANLYPLMIFTISIALLSQILLLSKYIVGYDAPLEYQVFKFTEIGRYWNFASIGNNPSTALYSSILSITILPTVYSVLMHTGGEIVFKTLYPLVFSFIPLALYRIYEKQTGKLIGFLSALFFISSPTVFYGVEPIGLNRQIIGELFFILSIFLLLDKTITTTKRRLLLIIFGIALIVSHYSLAYLYLAYIVLTFIISKIKRDADKTLNGAIVLLLFVMTFSWYTVVSATPLISLSKSITEIVSKFTTDIFNPVARSSDIVSPYSILTIASIINWALFAAAHLFIIIGVLKLILKPKESRLDWKYRTMSILSAVILFLCFVAPNFAPVLNFSRFYAITLLFLSPCFVFGGETLFGIVKSVWMKARGQHNSRKTHARIVTLLIAILLSAYFLSQSGFINRITGGAIHSYSIDFDRMKTSNDLGKQIRFYTAYIPEKDVFSAVWLSKNKGETSTIYADLISRNVVLTCYGLILREWVRLLTNTTMLEQGAYIYLGQLNVVNGVLTTYGEPFNTSEISSLLNESNKIYSNGNSEIWCATGR